MSFSGKKYKRVSSEGLEKLVEAAHISSDRAKMLLAEDSAFKFTRIDDQNYSFSMYFGGRSIDSTFKLGVEHDMERRDGTKVKVKHHLESENVLSQTIRDPNGKQAHFKREFFDDRCVLTISTTGSDLQAKIHYEVVDE